LRKVSAGMPKRDDTAYESRPAPDDEDRRGVASHSAVIARLDRATQYATAPRFDRTCSGILDPRFRGDDELTEH
jgi:hypothetical protein